MDERRTEKGTGMGEIMKSMLQFKSFPAAFLMRHGSRAMAQDGLKGKAAYGVSLFAMTTLLGALAVQLKELANGNDPLNHPVPYLIRSQAQNIVSNIQEFETAQQHECFCQTH